MIMEAISNLNDSVRRKVMSKRVVTSRRDMATDDQC